MPLEEDECEHDFFSMRYVYLLSQFPHWDEYNNFTIELRTRTLTSEEEARFCNLLDLFRIHSNVVRAMTDYEQRVNIQLSELFAQDIDNEINQA